jgi:hypothetical protein
MILPESASTELLWRIVLEFDDLLDLDWDRRSLVSVCLGPST